jgi:hypothetical protein
LKTDIQTSGSNCSGTTWDTAGWVPSQVSRDKGCAIPNWTYYGFQGTLSLCTNWTGIGATPSVCSTSPAARFTAAAGQAPSALPTTRSVCQNVPGFLVAPSCTNGRVGDWVETVSGTPIQSLLLTAVQQFGSQNEFSNTYIPSTTTRYGKALVVYAYLWDCGEHYQGGSWSLILNTKTTGTDCSDVANWANSASPDRVHLFAMAPFTFYEGLFQNDSNSIRGYWGGAFITPDSCPSGDCDLSTLNTTVLVGE